MQQSCTYGSVRGVPGNRRSYRDNPDVNFQLPTSLLSGSMFGPYSSLICSSTISPDSRAGQAQP